MLVPPVETRSISSKKSVTKITCNRLEDSKITQFNTQPPRQITRTFLQFFEPCLTSTLMLRSVNATWSKHFTIVW